MARLLLTLPMCPSQCTCSETLNFTPYCSSYRQVPLNYSDPNGSQAAIAVKRIRSSFPVNSPDYRGPILLNPGGPAASGVDFVTTVGDLVAQIVGPQFDVVGFDPRGESAFIAFGIT